MFDFEGQLNRLLSQQRAEAEQTVTSAASYAAYEAFSNAFYQINSSTLSSSTAGEQLSIDFGNLALLIDRWINELAYFVDDIRLQLQMFDPIPYEVINQTHNLRLKVEFHIIRTYEDLKTKITDIETDFSNVAIAYKSLVESSLNDMLIFHNNHNDIEGDFSRFNDVSVYVHGIEDTGDSFFNNMPEVSQAGDVVVHEKRNGTLAYYVVTNGENGLELSGQTEDGIKKSAAYAEANGRVHLIYETEFQNEHRQKTSNNLGETLINLGLMQGDKNIRMNAHSYGGRRSWQFAVDYPNHVEAITTIGTPYKTNTLAAVGHGVARITETVPGLIGKHPMEYNEHVELSSLDGAKSGVILNDNAYGDMVNNNMDEVVTSVTNANPDIHDDLQDMYITAVTGKQGAILPTDGAVSASSQSGGILGEYIDEQPVIKIFRDTIGIAHSAETSHGEFKSILRDGNRGDIK